MSIHVSLFSSECLNRYTRDSQTLRQESRTYKKRYMNTFKQAFSTIKRLLFVTRTIWKGEFHY